jgi:hypothetical protein
MDDVGAEPCVCLSMITNHDNDQQITIKLGRL